MTRDQQYQALSDSYAAQRASDDRDSLIGTVLFGALFLQVLGTIIYSFIR